MSDQQNDRDEGGMIDRAGDLAKKNPDAAGRLIDRAEKAVDTATGSRFADQVDKAGDLLKDKLGLPEDQTSAPPEQAPQTDPIPPEQAPGAPDETTEPLEPTSPDPTAPGIPGRPESG